VDRRQDRLRQVRRQGHRGVRRQGLQDEDQNQDVRRDHQGHQDVGHLDQDGIRLDHRGVRHQDQVEHQDRQDGHQDQDGNR
jgi:hypothetical protein